MSERQIKQIKPLILQLGCLNEQGQASVAIEVTEECGEADGKSIEHLAMERRLQKASKNPFIEERSEKLCILSHQCFIQERKLLLTWKVLRSWRVFSSSNDPISRLAPQVLINRFIFSSTAFTKIRSSNSQRSHWICCTTERS